MKKVALLLLIGVFALAFMGCPGKPPPPPPPPVDTAETTQPVEPEPEPEPAPPPKAELKEAQLQTVYFDFDKFNLRNDAKAALDHNASLLKEYEDVVIKIEGHCDERGTVEYNLSLGEKRAKAAQDYLVGLGIEPARISIISYGKERPIDTGHNEEAWAKNRRAEFRIISQ
ncbi:MAG: peptidoglycan-associated lipoprotein Pal [Candidatus Zixiibacteriota bacterium]